MKSLFAFVLAVTTFLWTPGAASAKAPTVRITISGGGLKRPIEVTDPQILDMSQAWGERFLDASRGPLKEAPQVDLTYEVSFYSGLAENDVRKTCVLYYSPSSSVEQGYIYLPGQGTVWILNAGTIMREGRDGRWNYASSAWEALIKAVISRAEGPQSSASVSSGGGPAMHKTGESSRASQVVIDEWTKPHPGWLYVLDPRSESTHPGSRVWLVDPETAKVIGSVHAGYDPDFALSPDGSRLFIASGERESGELAVIDTASGKVQQVPFHERVLYQPWYRGLPPFSRMAVSSDGVALWILDVFSPDKIGHQLRTFDTRSGHFSPRGVQLGNCGYGEFVPSSNARQIDFLCPATNSVHFISLDANYQEESYALVKLPWSGRCRAAEAFWLPENKGLAIVRIDGAIYEMDTTTREFSPTSITSDCSPSETLVYPFQWPRSTDGRTVYLAYGPLEPDGTATSREFRMFDTTTWKALGSFRTSVPFWSAVASRDGRIIYAPAPKEHSVLIIDTGTRQEKQALRIGQTPTLALVAP